MKTIKTLRIIFQELLNNQLIATTTENQTICLICTPAQQAELKNLSEALSSGTVFNLLNFKEIDGIQTAEFLVFEPDYLLDVSAISECFRPYGHHVLNYTLARLQYHETSSHILRGNAANAFMDEFIYEDFHHPVDYLKILKKQFHISAFEYTACQDLKTTKKSSEFFANCRQQFDNIRQVVKTIFPKSGFDKKHILLEPAFICNALGLQGRLDILLDDYSGFIELKAGKAVEEVRPGGQFIRSADNHYIQMTLYLAILEFNFSLDPDSVHSYLLYSKYPVLSEEKHSRLHLQEALKLRNQIVAQDYLIQRDNQSQTTRGIIAQICIKILNTYQMTGKFFDFFLAPGINRFTSHFRQLTPLEQSYFLRNYTFITKELWLSKTGEREYEGVKKAANLWSASFEDKLIAGELLHDLLITCNNANEEPPTLTLSIPEYDALYYPNFRIGDVVVLYERNTAADTVLNHQVFKASIETIDAQEISLRLRYRQKNSHIWNPKSRYAIEHDYIDLNFSTMYRGLYSFVQANPDRRDLLLGRFCSNAISLIIGPPGTGKTSIALKQLVEEEWSATSGNILLLAYTNRAVDEICKALADIDSQPPYIRIGSELNCAPEYRSHLQENALAQCSKRTEMADALCNARIFVGTAATINNKPELFKIKHFDLAIIDEATQLLEPHLIGIFCAQNASGANAVDRFVLIGDHKQLPAIVLQSKTDSAVDEPELNAIGLTNMSDSLFERLYRRYKHNGGTHYIRFLSKQGRMHPDIADFPSNYFYDGQLESIDLPHQIEQWNDRKRIDFYPIQPVVDERSNKTNRKEAEQVVAICRTLYTQSLDHRKPFSPQNIGIITPFRSQIALIHKLLKETGVNEFNDILVDTVERFQGSQRDVIIYSFCIQTESQLEALPNWLEEDGKQIDRKLNVAITRARKQLYIVGNKELLTKNELYKQLIGHIEAC